MKPFHATLVPVSKTKPVEDLMEAYKAGNRIFGENKVQEMVEKCELMPNDVEWHFIGHLQRNKVKYLAPFVSLIHSVDSPRLLREINKQARDNHRKIKCLLQVHIASESSKFGFSMEEICSFLLEDDWSEFDHVQILGLMGMATFTSNMDQVRSEFKNIRELQKSLQKKQLPAQVSLEELSIGMTNDYHVALEEGSTMIRIGTAIFGARNFPVNE